MTLGSVARRIKQSMRSKAIDGHCVCARTSEIQCRRLLAVEIASYYDFTDAWQICPA
jgi:hypothetical protein